MANVYYIDSMETMLEHLNRRHFNTQLHTAWVDEEDRVATFPLWTPGGVFAGYQAYRPDANKVQKNDEAGRYYTYRGKKLGHGPQDNRPEVRHVAVWGMESWNLTNTLFVTEGVFDAARLTNLGASAVAVISNDPNTSTRNWFHLVRQMRPVVVVCDPGKAGFKLRTVGHMYHVMDVPNQPDADLGDAPQWYVERLMAQYL